MSEWTRNKELRGLLNPPEKHLSGRPIVNARDFLTRIVSTRREVDAWIKGFAFPFQKYDSELGYLLRSARFKDGIDGSITTYDYEGYGSGNRRMIMHSDKPCRINTYGNSFTQSQQVSDGESWQEILAAHLCEPIRNFGVGGYSVYQAYLRMKREEKLTPTENIIFNIYDDDHYRSLVSWRKIRGGPVDLASGGSQPTSPYVKVNPSTREFVECENPCGTADSMYNLCDLDWIFETFKEDFLLKITRAHENVKEGYPESSYAEISDLASKHGFGMQITTPEELIKACDLLYTKASLFASMRIVEKVEEFAALNGKKVLYVLSFYSQSIAKMVTEGYRFDQEFVDFLKMKGLQFIDLMEAHLEDFSQFSISIEDYLRRYYVEHENRPIGHYNPMGNFFYAFAIKDKLVEMLNPKPISYNDSS